MKSIISRGMAFVLSFCLLLGCVSMFHPNPMKTVSAAATTVNYKFKKKAYQYKGESITITYNKKKIDFTDIPAFKVQDDVVMAAYKKVFQNTIGVKSSYDKKTKELVLKYNSNTLKMKMGSKQATLNGKEKTLEAAPMNITYTDSKENRVVVPVIQVCKLLDIKRSWAEKTNTLSISNQKTSTEAEKETTTSTDVEEEFKAMWVSYLELSSYMQGEHSEQAFTEFMNRIYDKAVDDGMNAVIVHVRPMGDAMYPSKYFPWSRYLTGTQGTNPGFNPLKIMINEAHERGLEFHAWVNPYRVSTSNAWDALSVDNPAKKWNLSTKPEEQRNVLSYNGALYYNPAKQEVQNLILNGVKEIVENYDVDGIHFDDYFYPTFTKQNVLTEFDAQEYTGTKTVEEIAKWRRNNVSQLIKSIHSMIDSTDQNVEFGISPAGSIENLKSDYSYYVDIETWLSQEGYIDYVIPQIYWGFTHKTADFSKMVTEWSTLNRQNLVDLYIGIGAYRVGEEDNSHRNISEWLDPSILKKQVLEARQNSRVKGFAFFSYAYFDLRSSYNFAEGSGIPESKYSTIEKAINELIPVLKSK